MGASHYFSARATYIILVDDRKPRRSHHYDEAVYVVKASSPTIGRQRLLRTAKSLQTVYRNDRGQRVRWSLIRLEDVRALGRSLDGKEISSQMSTRRSSEAIPYSTRLKLTIS